ncbi:MAG: diguanylate cyclase [Sphaerochaeta sp.]|nr:diguanylate cyclase [Sphaerochaeta sp.]
MINYILILFLILLGVVLSIFSYQKITQSYESQALNTIRTLSAALDTEEVRSLTGRDIDQNSPAYLAMKKRLSQTFSANAAYFFTIYDGLIYFMVDSEPIGSPDLSPPGQHYEEAPPEAYRVFAEEQPIITKAYTDRWGSWVSTFILLPQSEGSIPIAFGLDYNSGIFYTHAKLITLVASLLIVVLLVLFMISSLALKNNKLLQLEKDKATEATSLLKTFEMKVRQEKVLLETTLQSLGEAVISIDSEGRIVVMNRMAQKLTGWDIAEALGKPLHEVYTIVEGITLKPFEKPWPYKVLETGIPQQYDNSEIKLIGRNGKPIAIEDMVYPILDGEGTVTGAVLIFTDGTEKRLQKAELFYLSTHDGLTGLLNRQSFYAKMQEMDVLKHYPMVLMLFDVNGLKLINEAYGHTTGDSLLNEIAIILQRPWYKGQMVGRVDGDEFALFFPNATEEIVLKVSQEIQEALSEQAFSGYALTISHGYAKKEYAQTPLSELQKKAEDDLFRNKVVENQSAHQKMVDLLLQSLFKKSPREMEHSKRVGILAQRFGRHLGLPPEEVEALHTLGVFHDIGKIALATRILNKKSKLDADDWREIKRHPEIGFNILSSVNQYVPIAEQVLCHHERWDGKGYPNQISGDLIPLYSRILALCDTFDAMTNFRAYRAGVSVENALEEIKRCSNTQFDPILAGRFIEMYGKSPEMEGV